MLKNINKKTGQPHISRRVMERIKAEKVYVLPKSYFAARSLFLSVGIGTVFFLSVLFSSIAFRHFAITRLFGVGFVFANFPWFGTGLAFATLCVCFAVLEHYKVFYKWTLLGLATMLVFANVFGGFLLHKVMVRREIATRAAVLYKAEGDPLQVIAGRVVEIHGSGSVVILTLRGERINIYTTARTKMPRFGVLEGDAVYVAGIQKADLFVARGILKLGS